MPNKRDINLNNYGISRHRFHELRDFCLQYREWKDELTYKTNALKSPQITGMPFTGGTSNTTQELAVRRELLMKKCEIVELTMMETIAKAKKGNTNKMVYDGAAEDLFPHMIKAVTNEEVTYTYLDKVMNIPIGRDSFNNLRRYFYFLLDKNKTPYY